MLSGKHLLLGGLILFLARLSFFTEPMGISVDESTYLSIAEVLEKGGRLYVDALDRKPPGLFWLYQIHQKIFGHWNIHALHFSIFLLSLFLAYLAFRASKRVWGFWLYILFSSCLLRGVLAANAEYWMLLFLAPASILALRAFLEEKSQRARILGLSLATGLAAISSLFKQYGGLVYAAIYIWGSLEYLRWGSESWQKRMSIQLWAALGSFISLGLVYAATSFYFWKQGTFSEFLYFFVLESFDYMGQDRGLNQQTKSGWIFLSLVLSWLPLWILSFQSLWKYGKSSAWHRSWAVGFIAALFTAFLSGRHYTHYFVPAIWYLSVLAAPSADALYKKLQRKFRIVFLSFLVLPYLVFSILNTFQESFSSHWTFTKKRQFELEVVGQWIKMHSNENDRICVWGMASQIYVFSNRGSATPFIFADFASGRLPGFKSEVSIPMPGAMESYLRSLDEQKPLYFINTSTAHLNDYGAFPLSRFPELESFIQENYQLEANLMNYELWKLKKIRY